MHRSRSRLSGIPPPNSLAYVLIITRHFYPNAELRFPALVELPHLQPIRALLLSGGICEYLCVIYMSQTHQIHYQT
jgi:hypothetical protein